MPRHVNLVSQASLRPIGRGVRSEMLRQVNLVCQAALRPTGAPKCHTLSLSFSVSILLTLRFKQKISRNEDPAQALLRIFFDVMGVIRRKKIPKENGTNEDFGRCI